MKKLGKYFFANKKDFAKGLCKEKLFFVFLFGCVFGCFYEELLDMFTQYSATGSFVWITKRGLLYGELSPVYGGGAVLLTYILMRKERAWYKNYLYGALIGGSFEYVMSLIQELLTGTVSWDYTGYLLNIGGRTTIPFMLFWGILALLFVYIFYPFLSYLIERIPYNLGKLLYYIFLVLVLLDMLISYGAVARQTLRRWGHSAYTPIGEFFDYYYPDERIAKAYTNSVFK